MMKNISHDQCHLEISPVLANLSSAWTSCMLTGVECMFICN